MRWTWCGMLLLAGCASTTFEGPPSQDPGVATPVEVIEPGFVRFEGQRRALEWFLYEMRCRARDAAGDPNRLPRVVVVVDEGAELGPRGLAHLTEELHKAGIRQVELGSAP